MSTSEETPLADQDQKLSSLRINIIVLWISLFLAALDSTIISTALFSISHSLHGSSESGWVITSYLLTYNAFVLILAKLSDIVGLKHLILLSNAIFLVFSIACSVSQSMQQLIVFRAFQGIGASGLYCLVFIAILQLISLEKSGFYSGIISSVFALSNLLGPLSGGLIVDHTTWRWIFYLNIPLSAISILILGFAMPAPRDSQGSEKRMANFDIPGAILSVCWLVPLLFALEEGGSQYSWHSSVIIGTLTGGIVALITFLVYEAGLHRKHAAREPIFPIVFLRDSLQALLLLNIFLAGFAFYTAIIILPQRFQAVNGLSAARAGVLLLAMTLCLPLFSLIAGFVLGKRPQWTMFVLGLGNIFILAATACLSCLSIDPSVSDAQYGFQVIMGAGLGITSTAQYFALKIIFHPRDTAAATGSMNMLRALGGCVGLAINTAMLSARLSAELPSSLTAEEVMQDRTSWDQPGSGLSTTDQDFIRRIYGRGYNSGFAVMIAFAGANVLVAGLLVVVNKRRGGIEKLLAEAQSHQIAQ
ncbi:hypothetical protein ARAM_006068 [Aspergillus rambellii]|uniref:Major facilitator superfamily (MFS) profile domain-containing protein n=1 Tax=Aspergillus rambellii TaxID=308745 RepID=A0A0F8UY60_9EURO|nr:hypothetical protein ARAM_006068 [Aspergillus rambellii]